MNRGNQRRWIVVIGGLLSVVALGGCRLSELSSGTDCTKEVVYAVGVQVIDSVSGKWIGSGSTLVATEGTYADSAALPTSPDVDSWFLIAAPERAGIYTVTVRRAGYRDWTQSDVVVTRGICHVDRVNLVATMQPAP